MGVYCYADQAPRTGVRDNPASPDVSHPNIVALCRPEHEMLDDGDACDLYDFRRSFA